MDKEERNKFINALIYPVLFVTIIGLISLVEYVFELKFTHYGVYPRKIKGLIGIITSPLIHASFSHLFNNSIPILILGSTLFYFYKEVALKVVLWVYLMVGVWTWISAREAYHIGASGIVYGLFAFLLFSGFIRKNTQLISLSFFVSFLYGGMVWGVFPIDPSISFEGHLWGFVAGIILAIYYRKQGPQKKKYDWGEEDDDNEGEHPYWKPDEKPTTTINYIFKPKKDLDKN